MDLKSHELAVEVSAEGGEAPWTSPYLPFAVMDFAPKFLADLGVGTLQMSAQIWEMEKCLIDMISSQFDQTGKSRGDTRLTRLGRGIVRISRLDNKSGMPLNDKTVPVNVALHVMELDDEGEVNNTTLRRFQDADDGKPGIRSLTLMQAKGREDVSLLVFEIIREDENQAVRVEEVVDEPTEDAIYSWFLGVNMDHITPALTEMKDSIAVHFGITE